MKRVRAAVACVRELGRKDLPVESKILDSAPEPWTNLEGALPLKAMALSLTSYGQDAAVAGPFGLGRPGTLFASPSHVAAIAAGIAGYSGYASRAALKRPPKKETS